MSTRTSLAFPYANHHNSLVKRFADPSRSGLPSSRRVANPARESRGRRVALHLRPMLGPRPRDEDIHNLLHHRTSVRWNRRDLGRALVVSPSRSAGFRNADPLRTQLSSWPDLRPHAFHHSRRDSVLLLHGGSPMGWFVRSHGARPKLTLIRRCPGELHHRCKGRSSRRRGSHLQRSRPPHFCILRDSHDVRSYARVARLLRG